MKAEWELKALSSLLEVKNGYAFDSKKFTPDAGTPLIRIRDIKEGKGTAINYNGEYNEEFICKRGDFLISMDGEFGCYEWKGDPSLLNQRVCRLENFDSGLMSRFLFYGINKYLKEIEEVTGYTTVKHLSSKTIKTIEFPLPPLEEQKRIVSILDEAFEGLDRARENAEANLKSAQELFDATLESTFVPYGDTEWEIKTLGEVCSLITRGIAPKYIESGGLRVLNQKCIRSHSINFDLTRRNNSELKRVPDARLIEIGDVLVNSTGTGTLGRVAQVLDRPIEPTTVDTHVTIVRPQKECFYPAFFGYMLIKIEDELIAAGQGTSGQTELPRKDLEAKFNVSYPTDIEEQKRISFRLDKASSQHNSLKEKYTTKIQDIADLRQSLLQKAFAGELT